MSAGNVPVGYGNWTWQSICVLARRAARSFHSQKKWSKGLLISFRAWSSLMTPIIHSFPWQVPRKQQEAIGAVHNIIWLLGGGAHGKHRAGVLPLNPVPGLESVRHGPGSPTEQNCYRQHVSHRQTAWERWVEEAPWASGAAWLLGRHRGESSPGQLLVRAWRSSPAADFWLVPLEDGPIHLKNQYLEAHF